MTKRTVKEIWDEARLWRDNGSSALQSLAATLSDSEWEDLFDLVPRLDEFYEQNRVNK